VRKEVRDRYVNDVLANIDTGLARTVADRVGVRLRSNHVTAKPKLTSPALSIASSPKGIIKGLRVAILVAPGADSVQIAASLAELKNGGAVSEVVSTVLGPVVPGAPEATKTIWNSSSVLWDAVYVPGGQASVDALRARGDVVPFIKEAFRHAKPIGGSAEGADFVESAILEDLDATSKGQPLPGVVLARAGQMASFPADFVRAIGEHRFWERSALVPPRT
jgi:catalase